MWHLRQFVLMVLKFVLRPKCKTKSTAPGNNGFSEEALVWRTVKETASLLHLAFPSHVFPITVGSERCQHCIQKTCFH